MKRVPTKLKQLAERRARVLGALNTCVPMEQYSNQLELIKSQLKNMEALVLASANKKESLLKELADIDKQFLDTYPTVNTASIAPIVAWKGKYGKYGSLTKFVLDTLKSYSPAFVPAPKLAELAIIEFSLGFADSATRRKWYDNSFRTVLKQLLNDGLVEQSEKKLSPNNKALTYWRPKEEERTSLADLSAQSESIAAAGH